MSSISRSWAYEASQSLRTKLNQRHHNRWMESDGYAVTAVPYRTT